MRKKRAYIGFITPAFIVYTLFMIVPILFAIYYSFFEWNGIGEMKFLGLQNYINLLGGSRISKTFYNALFNNFKYYLCVLVFITPIQIFFAYIIYIKIPAYKYIQFMLFLPYVISTSIIGFFVTMMFDPNIGVLNNLLKKIGLKQFQSAWLGDQDLVFKIFIIVVIWACIGSGMMIIYANMQDIPESIIEAAVIDGANERMKFFRVVLPMLTPSLQTVLTLAGIFALTMFDIPFMLGGPQGGVNNKIDFVNMVFYRTAFGGSYFGETSLGLGASISVTMFIVILVLYSITVKLLKKLEY